VDGKAVQIKKYEMTCTSNAQSEENSDWTQSGLAFAFKNGINTAFQDSLRFAFFLDRSGRES
jgi:hypothetical protein